jgi:hypothetical protein
MARLTGVGLINPLNVALWDLRNALEKKGSFSTNGTIAWFGSFWMAVKKAWDTWVQRDYVGLVKKCLEGMHQLLLDDLLTEKNVEPIPWHDQFAAYRVS